MQHRLKAVTAILVAMSFSGPVLAQNLTPSYITSDNSMRSSKLIGMAAYNEKNEKIGTIDDIMLPMAGGEVNVVLSVGGFLGIGAKLIKVPFSHVHLMGDKAMMPGGGKAELMAMPAYQYYGRPGGG